MATPARNPTFFPPFVAMHSVELDVADPRDPSEHFPSILVPETLRTAVRKRQLEFVAGRHCAREALRRCAPELADLPITCGASGEPLWPPGVVGAITHAAGYVSAAVARAGEAQAIGLDAEKWMDPDVASNVLAHLASGAELEALARATGLTSERALTLLFSAKESLYKCLFPQVQRYFDFRDAWIACGEAERGTLAVTLLASLTPSLPAGRVFDARFAYDERLVYTGMVLIGA